MANNRIRFSNNFVLKDEKVGINTTDPQALLDVGGELRVSGASTFTSNVDIETLNVDGVSTLGFATVSNLYVSGVSTLTVAEVSNLNVSGVSTFAGIVTTTGDLYVGGDLYLSEDLVFDDLATNSFAVINNAIFSGKVGIGSTLPQVELDVFGNTRLEYLEVSGITTLGFTTASSLYVSGVSTLGFTTTSSLYVSGVSTLGFATVSNLYVSGVSTLSSVDVSTLSVSGISSLGFTTTSDLYVSGVSTFAGIVTSTGDLYVGGDLYVQDDLLFDSFSANSFDVINNATIGGNLGIGTTNPQAKLDVNGNGNFTGIVSAFSFIGSGSSLTGLIPNTIEDIDVDSIYYPLLSSATSGTISSISVSSNSIVFNPALSYLGIGTTNPTSRFHISGIGNTDPNIFDGGNRIRIGDYHWDDTYTTIHAKKISAEWWLEQNSPDDDGVDLIFYKSRGLPNEEEPVQVGDNLFRLAARAYRPNSTGIGTTISLSDYSTAGIIEFNVDEIIGNNVFGSIDLKTSPQSSGLIVKGNGDVGIGTTNPQYNLHVVGDFGATTKSFVIPHPTKPGMTLRHGSLEGNELAVYVRGKTTESIIPLPDYWTGLVDEDSITVNLTANNDYLHRVVKISNNTVEIKAVGGDIDCYFMVLGERKDVAKLEVEY